MRPAYFQPSLIALACSAILASPAWAANSGGSTGTPCGPTGYIGVCASAGEPATGAQVYVDIAPVAPTDPVIGGASPSPTGIARDNTVTIDGVDTFNGSIIGGYGGDQAISNTVTVRGTTVINSYLFGGDGQNEASSNTTIIGGNATATTQMIAGGTSLIKASNNQVILEGHSKSRIVIGGNSSQGDVIGNTVLARDYAMVTYTGAGRGSLYGAKTGTGGTGNAIGNQVSILGDHATIDTSDIIGGGVYGTGNAIGNLVRLGGHIAVFTSAANTMIAGGAVFGSGNAINNQVILGEVSETSQADIYGGYANSGHATGNTIMVTDRAAPRNSTLYGGWSNTGNATGNRIVLSGNPDLILTTLLGGGGGGPGDYLTGNVLDIRTGGLKAVNVSNFASYSFLLPSASSTPILELTEAGTATNIAGATASVDVAPGAAILQPGTQVTLLKNSSGLTSTAYSATPTAITGRQGFALDYQFGLTADGQNLYATVDSVQASEASKAPVEGRVALLALANQGSDLAAGLGMARARNAATTGNWTAFGAISGGHSRYESGSHVNMDGMSLLAGAARHFDTGASALTAGAFLEAGYGNYSSDNTFADGLRVHGSGSSHYVGAGLLTHIDFDGAHPDTGLYAEASLRAGRLDNDWNSRNLPGVQGQNASYDSNATYLSAHLGMGYRLPLWERSTADLYAQYFWSHLGSDDATIADTPYSFKATDSHRSRVGARISLPVSEQARAYVGAAWEHEFDARARATVYGFDTPSPSLKGDTGVFELGLDMTPGSTRALTVGLGVQAYVGKRQGIGGSATLQYAF